MYIIQYIYHKIYDSYSSSRFGEKDSSIPEGNSTTPSSHYTPPLTLNGGEARAERELQSAERRAFVGFLWGEDV